MSPLKSNNYYHMKARWCISAIIFILTLFGVVNQQQIALPNQEIVLQFTDVQLSSDAAKNTIARVKGQLQAIGVDNLQVLEGENGQLKITYYSDADVASIQKTLSRENNLTLDYSDLNQDRSNLPHEEYDVSYNLDVFEIQKVNDTYSGEDGKVVLEPKPKNDRIYNPTFDVSSNDIRVSEKENLVKVAYKIAQQISFEIEEALHSIPEVRAGPIC
ncbi:MAG: hypothetical protein ABJK28_01605 [Algibacter sp.]